jgi:hypothetical protein
MRNKAFTGTHERHKHGFGTNADLPTYFPEKGLERAPVSVHKLDIQAV